MGDIDELIELVIKFRNERNWKQFHNPKDMAVSLSLEASEFLEHFQWKNAEEISIYLKTNKAAVSDELADCLIWVLTISHDLKIDLHHAVTNKVKKNAKKYPVAKAKGKHTKYNRL